jgi:LysR family hydrogen peroxide-inducible transcriptional activator
VRRFDPPVVGRQIGLAWRKGSARVEEVELLGQLLKGGSG